MRRIPKPLKKILKSRGRVELMSLTDPDTRVVIFAVGYPHKVGETEGTLRMTSQFLCRKEAEKEYELFAQFFSTSKDLRDTETPCKA